MEIMKQVKDVNTRKRLEYTHCVIFNNKEYRREEVVISSDFFGIEGFHTISWMSFNWDEYQRDGNIEYYSHDKGWSDGKILNKSNPVPEIERVFKETIGKDLIYF